MDVEKYSLKELQLKEVLEEIGNFNLYPDEASKRLVAIYNDGFRHSYSQITDLIFNFNDEQRSWLSEVLKEVLQSYEKGASIGNEEAYQKIKKLKDHVDLEITHFRVYSNEKISTSLMEMENKINNAKQKLNDIENSQWEVSSKVENSNTQSITVLSIFAGIVFAFTGGFSLMGSAMQNINLISKYRLFFIILLFGFILFNVIFMLLFFIGKITDRSLAAGCRKGNQYYCDDKCPYANECNVVKAFIRRYPYAFYVNVALIGMMGLLAVFWLIQKYIL